MTLPPASTAQSRTPTPTLLTIGVILAALALYLATLAPGLLWGGGDFARFQTWAYLGRIEGGVDVFAHPLWVILAHPFTWLPIGTPAWRANFASAVFGVAALACTFLAARYLTRANRSALLATAALALSHTFWTYAVMPKVYSLNALMLAACMYLLLRWRARDNNIDLCLFAFIYGLSLLNHLVMATAAAGFMAFIGMTLWPRRRTARAWGALLLALLCFGLGLAPYLYLTFQSGTAAATGGTVGGFMTGLLYAATHPRALLAGIGWGVALGIYQFPISTIVGALGLYQLWRHDIATAAAISLIILGTVAFLFGALDPSVGNVYVWNLHYYLQAYVAFALALAPGFDTIWQMWVRGRRERASVVVALTLALPVLLYAAAPLIARPFVANVPDFRPLPGRDNLRYVLSPWKQNETGARDLGEQIVGALPPHSVLFADYSLWAVVQYLQVVEHARPDVELVLLTGRPSQVATILDYRDRPSLFLADIYRYYDVKGIGEHFEIVPAPPIYRLIPK
jgi:hypothetical protein